jgi:hypothetical protein
MDKITRRQALQVAGGITFLALTRTAGGLFAAPNTEKKLPDFTVLPYIQPGNGSRLTKDADTLVVCWQTEDAASQFEVSYGPTKKYGWIAVITQTTRLVEQPDAPSTPTAQTEKNAPPTARPCRNYSAALTGLSLGRKYYYRVQENGQTIAEGYATTRTPRGHKIRLVAFGDNSAGTASDHAIAYYAYQARPDFVMNTGDNVYERGLDHEYSRYFFPVYNADVASPATGAPLLRSVPFYTVIANHDVPYHHSDSRFVADFNAHRDSLAYYTAMHMPLNGPAELSSPTPLVGDQADVLTQFQACAGERFPKMANYSFDYGDVHFLCLDSNLYVDPTDTALQHWIEQDLMGTDAPWKFVVYHHPAFNVGHEHYREQHMRVLSPLLEKCGVDLVLHGHEHTYQRTMPIRFRPTDVSKASLTRTSDRRIPGEFDIDRAFDGSKVTKPNGLIYITTGAGGKDLYDAGYDDAPERWQHADDQNAAYIARFYSSLHSLTVIDVDGPAIDLRQINEQGQEIDHIRITKE